jgi:hypothetical protein
MFIARVRRKIINSIIKFLFLLGCYQDKLHPHERNRKQLETKFNKQPGGGANSATTAEAAAAAEPAGDEE